MQLRPLALLGLSCIVAIPILAAADEKPICNFAPKANSFNLNPLLVTSINQFGLRLNDDVDHVRAVTRHMIRPADVSAKYFLIDPSVVKPYTYGYSCKKEGLASIDLSIQSPLPTSYDYCFTVPNGTFFDAEQFLEDRLGIPRVKWLVYSLPLTSYRAKFIRKTRIGAWILGIESGTYNLRVDERYFLGFIMITYQTDQMAIHFSISDSTDSVSKQIACEEKR